ncbi:acyl-CoA dehydrogenase [Streptomyces sp. NPDC002588]|uniref:acyl-CoA dehydrogenase n=1 Tax=Streptomyces sp. NPDC002588 TaxID=3154419 RepID=UPI00331CC864
MLPEKAKLGRWASVRGRISEVDHAFGDPWSPDNPLGFDGVLAAAGTGMPAPAALDRYDGLALNAEFVPAELGGRLDGLDVTGAVFRPVMRRDARLAAVGGISSLLAAFVVWAGGNASQRLRTSEVLLGGARLAIACHQLEHANIFFEEEFRARRSGSGYLLSGRKPAINNLDHAELILAYAATGDGDGPQTPQESHSLFLLDRAELPDAWVRRLTKGPAGSGQPPLTGLELLDCPVPGEARVGGWGQGVVVGASAYPLINATVASMLIGLGDTALRATLRFRTHGPAPAGRRINERQVRTVVNGAFADLLTADCLALVATRALHLLPGECDVLAAAAKYLVPKLLSESMYSLSVVLGGAFHTEEGPSTLVRKHLRDLDTVSFGHVGSAVCQTVIVPYLPLLAADAEALEAARPPAGLFRPGDGVPGLSLDRPAHFGGADGLWGYVSRALAEDSVGAGTELAGAFRPYAVQLAEEMRDALREFATLGPVGGGAVPDARGFPLSERYALVLAAAACVGVWRESGGSGFLADPAWLLSALDRILRRLGRPVPPLPAEVEARLFAEARLRADSRIGFDLYGAELAG